MLATYIFIAVSAIAIAGLLLTLKARHEDKKHFERTEKGLWKVIKDKEAKIRSLRARKANR